MPGTGPSLHNKNQTITLPNMTNSVQFETQIAKYAGLESTDKAPMSNLVKNWNKKLDIHA